MSVHSSQATPQSLNSWKEIATYLGRGVGTAQRYERELHLLVRRFGGTRSSVLAIPNELDLWVKQRTAITSVTEGGNTRVAALLAAVQKSIVESIELRNENRALRKLHTSAIHDLNSSIHALTKTAAPAMNLGW